MVRPSVEPKCDVRGTPLGVPVVPAVRMMTWPAPPPGVVDRDLRFGRCRIDNSDGLAGSSRLLGEFMLTDDRADLVRADCGR